MTGTAPVKSWDHLTILLILNIMYLQSRFRIFILHHTRVYSDGQLWHVQEYEKWVNTIQKQKRKIGTEVLDESLSITYCVFHLSPTANVSKIMYSFSLIRNVKQLLSVNESPDDIKSVHGIRALNAFMLLASHKSMAMFFNPYSNRTAMTEVCTLINYMNVKKK